MVRRRVAASTVVKHTCPNCGVKLRGTSLATHLAERCVLRRGGSIRRAEGARAVPVLARVAEEPRTVRPCRWCKRPTLLANVEVHERICSVRSMASPAVTTPARVTATLPVEPRLPPSSVPKPPDAAVAAPKALPPPRPPRRPPPIIEVRKRGSVR